MTESFATVSDLHSIVKQILIVVSIVGKSRNENLSGAVLREATGEIPGAHSTVSLPVITFTKKKTRQLNGLEYNRSDSRQIN